GNVCDVDEKESLEKLRDHLVRADEQHHFPFRPIANAIDLAKNDAEENDLPAEPEDFDDHPKEEVGFETHLADERIAQHDGVDVDVTPHFLFLSLVIGEVNLHRMKRFFPLLVIIIGLIVFAFVLRQCRQSGAANYQTATVTHG